MTPSFATRRSFCNLLCLLLCTAPALLAARPTEQEIPMDPAVTIGKLDNGLTYYIRANKEPENRVTLRLAVRAGSLQEDDDQQGLAHFLEHMAFNGTEHFKKQELVDYLEKIGTRFGADLNASTWFEHTVYKLQVPTDDEEILNKAFLIMEDWAGGVSLEAEEIEKERGVVIEEWRGDRGASARIRDKQLPKLFYQSRYAARLPIGVVDILEHAPAEAFRRFYKEWYRPDLMAVVVVGDMAPEKAEALIKQHFSALKNPEGARPLTQYPVPAHKQTLFSIDTDPELTSSTIDIYHKQPATPTRTLADYRENLVLGLHQGMLNDRLAERAREADPPFVSGYSFHSPMVATLEAHVQGALVKGDDFEGALTALLGEVRRARTFGFTQTELDRRKKDMLRSLEQGYKERDKTRSVHLATSYVDHFTSGRPIPGIEHMQELARKYLPTITLEEVNAVSNDLSEENRAIFLTAPEKEGLKVPTEAEILAMIDKAGKAEVTAYVDNVSDAPLLAQAPTPGKVTATRKVESLGITEWTLANGARVILKPTDFKNDEVLFTAYSHGGSSLVSDEDYVPALTSSLLVDQSGLGPFDAVELEKKLAGKNVSISASVGELAESLDGAASPEDLETMLQLLYLYCTAPRLDDAIFASITSRYAALLENREASPNVVFGDRVTKLLFGDHVRAQPFDKTALAKMNAARSLELFKQRFADGGDFTYLFVGNFDPEHIKPLVETYLGGLPDTGKRETWGDVGKHYATGVHELEVKKGLEPKSSVRLIFTGTEPWTPESRYHFISVNQALNIRLREILREDMGGVYGVGVDGTFNRYPEATFLASINFGCDPNMVDALTEAADKELARLAKEGFEPVYLEKVQETQLRTYEVSKRDNRFWLRNLAYYYRNELDPESILTYPEKVAALSLDDLRKAVGTFYGGKNRIRAVLKPEETPAGE